MFRLFKTKPRRPEIWRHQNLDAMSLAAAAFVRETAKRLVAQHGRFTLGLGGGRAFKQVYEYLCRGPVHSALHWPAVHLFWAIETCGQAAENNHAFAREQLIEHAQLPVENVHPLCPGPTLDLDACAVAYEAEIARFFGLAPPNAASGVTPVFDCLLLENDLAPELPQRWVANFPPSFGRDRLQDLGMTATLVNAARNVLVFAAGPDAGAHEHTRLAPAGRFIWLLVAP